MTLERIWKEQASLSNIEEHYQGGTRNNQAISALCGSRHGVQQSSYSTLGLLRLAIVFCTGRPEGITAASDATASGGHQIFSPRHLDTRGTINLSAQCSKNQDRGERGGIISVVYLPTLPCFRFFLARQGFKSRARSTRSCDARNRRSLHTIDITQDVRQ